MKEKPRIVLVGGDANCNLAGALAARKLHIKAGHIEAGERSFDWRMPEEHNRVIIDHISDYLFTTNAKGKDNLIRDRVRGKIFTVGNPIVDAVYQNLGVAEKNSQILEEYGLRKKEYFLLTLHREENVDVKANLKNILKAMSLVCSNFKRDIIFLIHPRTKKRIKEFNLSGIAKSNKGLRIKNATGYLDFLKLLNNASLVFTDSGGVQQEACILGIPCVTLRDNTEWVETVKIGANITSGTEPNRILSDTGLMLKRKNNWNHTFGDGKTAQYIVEIIKGKLESD
jgi:UDP-N-acetylglucosamine 2-epimerase (non-hydrolysing)